MVINDVISAMSRALDDRYPDIPIHGEEIKQNLDPPSFFIKLFPVNHTRKLGRRYMRQHTFDVHYFPQGFDADDQVAENEEMHGVAESLYDRLEYIECNGLIRGTKMRHEIINGVLHFFVDYNIHLMRDKKDGPVMQVMVQEGHVK
ncbi:hypothetical protein EBB07_33810 [Paenibacillaceae bacterium]|nr:hypothetical protein EBB07_33810 [Paenibacillaceae bacterium]